MNRKSRAASNIDILLMTLSDPDHPKLPVILNFGSSFICLKTRHFRFGIQVNCGKD